VKKILKFITVSTWILFTRVYDTYATYQHTPDLIKEANPLVSIFGFNWLSLLITLIFCTMYVIYAYYIAIFEEYNLLPEEKGYTFSHFIGYIYTGKKQHWLSLFYKIPKDLKRFNHFMGIIFTKCLVFAGVVSTMMWLLINNTEFYKNIHSAPLIYLILITGCFYIYYRWYTKLYSKYII